MIWLLSPKIWIAITLAAALGVSHLGAYRAGTKSIRAQWDKDIATRVAFALQAEQAARKTERELVVGRNQLEVKYVEQKRKDSAAAAVTLSELDRLRDELANHPGLSACPDTAASPRAYAGYRVERELLGNCAQALTNLAQQADELENLVVGLQNYVRQMCLKQ